MAASGRPIAFYPEELSGSRLRCLMYTSGSAAQVAVRLTQLVAVPGIEVKSDSLIAPHGFLRPTEITLTEADGFLAENQREALAAWWLQVRRGANTPNWDIAATAAVGGRPGLLLVEAKAREGELETAAKRSTRGKTNPLNHERIGQAIKEANDRLNQIRPGWGLSRDTHYQLSNRFAWSWKIASLGVPVVLVYLGFLNADEMPRPFRSAAAWADRVREWSRVCVPEAAWGAELGFGTTPFIPLLRAAEIRFEPSVP